MKRLFLKACFLMGMAAVAPGCEGEGPAPGRVYSQNPSSTATPASLTMGVLRLAYVPERTCGTGRCLDEGTTGQMDFPFPDNQVPLDAVTRRIEQQTEELAKKLSAGSRYKNEGRPFVNYHVAQSRRLASLPINRQLRRPDYRKILNDAGICDLVDRLGMRQVWMWSWHYDGNNPDSYIPPLDPEKVVHPAESNMAMGRRSRALFNHGTYGDVSNGKEADDMPQCENTYTLFNYTYQYPGAGNHIHNHIHQLENLLEFANVQLFWNRFGGKQYFEQAGAWVCGNAHWAPNSVVKGDEYRYDLGRRSTTPCLHWDPDGFSASVTVDCSAWGCNDQDYYVWFMQRLPGYGNQLSYRGRYLRNWWMAAVDFDSFYGQSKDLVSAHQAPSKHCKTFRIDGQVPDRCRGLGTP